MKWDIVFVKVGYVGVVAI